MSESFTIKLCLKRKIIKTILIQITPENITIAYHGLEKSTISLTSKFSLTHNGVSLYVFEIHNSIVKIQLIIDGVHYEVRNQINLLLNSFKISS